jgi:hypothetical protein
MYCPKCGDSIAENVTFCSACGNKLAQLKRYPSKLMLGLAGIAAAVSMGFALWPFFREEPIPSDRSTSRPSPESQIVDSPTATPPVTTNQRSTTAPTITSQLTAAPQPSAVPDSIKTNVREPVDPRSDHSLSPKSGGAVKSGKVLLLVVEAIDGKPVENGAIAQGLTKRLAENSLSVTHGAEIGGSEVGRMRRELQRVQTGDRIAGEAIPFAVIVVGTIQVTIPDPPEGVYYIAFADGAMRATTTSGGRTVAVENVSRIRGFGNTRDQAARDALTKAGEKISESFIRQISTNAR